MQHRKLIISENSDIKEYIVLSCHQGVSKLAFTFESLRDLLKMIKPTSHSRPNKLSFLWLGQRH